MTAILLLPLGVALCNLFALVLVLVRGPAFGLPVYKPMVLNLALSVAPAFVVAVSLVLQLAVITFAPSPVLL